MSESGDPNKLRALINKRAEAASKYGEESKQVADIDAAMKEETGKLPKPPGTGPHWKAK